MSAIRDHPGARLTAHFFRGLFDLGFLSETATASFTQLVIGVCAAFIAFGLLLTRAYGAKYVALSEMSGPDPYRHAVVVDHIFLIALPMWVVGFVTVLVAHCLFPDETDFRVLSPLPITRRLVFGAKAMALLMFAGVFTGFMHVAIAPMLVMTSASRWAEGLFIVRAGALVLASVLASAFSVLVVAAVQGALLLFAPGSRAVAIATAVRTAMLCALMLCLPFIGRLPAQARSFAAGDAWWMLVPPAWFGGIERWMLGDTRPSVAHLAALGAAALSGACLIGVGSYALLYRHFERLTVRAANPPGLRRSAEARRRSPRRPVFAAVRQFVFVTLRRSALHQGVTLVVSAIGAGLVLNSFISQGLVGWFREGGVPTPALVLSLVWAPFAFIYVCARAVRLAFLLPIEPRANWVFRMTECESSRADQMAAAAHVVVSIGVIAPIALLLPIQVRVLGGAAIAAVMVTAGFGCLYVELLMRDWARLPFTCSYIPGKGFVPQRAMLGTFFFVSFTTIGTAVANGTMGGSALSLAGDAVLVAAVVALRRRRIGFSRITPLEFEDVMPTELFPLKLGEE